MTPPQPPASILAHVRALSTSGLQVCLWLTLALVPIWWKLPDAPPPFSATYVMGFAIVLPLLATIGLWLVQGLPGLNRLTKRPICLLWLISCALLLGWAFISQYWAFVADTRPGVAQTAILQLGLGLGFAVTILSVRPSPRRWMQIIALLGLVHGFIGIVQVLAQSSLGLPGEASLDPARSGVSVIQAGNWRWLRPHGLLPHPNILAGWLVCALLAASAWTLKTRRWGWAAGLYAVLLSALLLTFSRGAWVALGAGMLVALFFCLREPAYRRRLLSLAGLSAIVGATFILAYWPLINARTGDGQENTEMRSIADRIVYTRIAFAAIDERPLQGHGAGNYPWYAAHYLHHRTTYDLRGDNVHNIYLGIWADTGLTGLILFVLVLGLPIGAGLRDQWRQVDPWRLAGLASLISFGVIGLVDHYPWTMLMFQALWLGTMALILSEGDT